MKKVFIIGLMLLLFGCPVFYQEISVEKPSFTPKGGTYDTVIEVTISTATSGASIYYTLDGSTPNHYSKLYSGPITIDESITIKAIAIKTDWIDSDITSESYTITDTLSEVYNSLLGLWYVDQQEAPNGWGDYTYEFTDNRSLLITHFNIEYIEYSGSVTEIHDDYLVSINAPGDDYPDGEVMNMNYRLVNNDHLQLGWGGVYYLDLWREGSVTPWVSRPEVSVDTSIIYEATEVVITSGTVGASFYYTLDGSEPTTSSTLYTGPFIVSETNVLKVISTASGYQDSGVTERAYDYREVGDVNIVANGTFSLGDYFWNDWSKNSSEADFYYNGDNVNVDVQVKGDDAWNIGFQNRFTLHLEMGQIYNISFDAFSSTESAMSFRIGEWDRDLNDDGNNYSNYIYRVLDLTNEVVNYSFDFYMSELEDDDTLMEFFFSLEEGNFTIDNIVLEGRTPDSSNISTSIPDENLRRAIADSNNIESNELHEGHFMLSRLEADGYDISDLTGLDLLSGLDTLILNDNSISDISPLGNLTYLRELELRENNVGDISFIANNSSLQFIHLQGNPLDSDDFAIFTPENFPYLMGLFLNSYDETNSDVDVVIDIFNNLPTLEHLGYSEANMTDDQFLSLYNGILSDNRERIYGLALSHNNLTDQSLELIGNLTNIYWLQLKGNPVSDLTLLSDMNNLNNIILNKTDVTDLQPLEDMYNDGLFHPAHESIIFIEDNGLDLSEGTNNRAVIDYLIDEGVEVVWEEGNYTDTLIELSTLTFNDPVLAQAVSDTGATYIQEVRELVCEESGLTDLSGIENLVYLEILEVESNNISDITPLLGLENLFKLKIADNNISDISQLGSISSLHQLFIGGNPIDDISPIYTLPNLEELGLESMNISNLDFLSNLLDLYEIVLANNDISDISYIDNMTQLYGLDLSHNQIGDISNLNSTGNLDNLQRLKLRGNSITDVSSLSSFTNLEVLDLTDNQISDISDLSTLTQLKELELGRNSELTDISPIASLINLEDQLDISHLPLSNDDIQILSNFTKLTNLAINGTYVSDLGPLSSLTNLMQVYLSELMIVDLTPLETLYSSGAFQPEEDAEIDISYCNLDVSEGSTNRNIVDTLISGGVYVNWEEGNHLNGIANVSGTITIPSITEGSNYAVAIGTFDNDYNVNISGSYIGVAGSTQFLSYSMNVPEGTYKLWCLVDTDESGFNDVTTGDFYNFYGTDSYIPDNGTDVIVPTTGDVTIDFSITTY